MSMFQKATHPGAGANRKSPPEKRFYSHIVVGDHGCWEWTAWVAPNGYAYMGVDSRLELAHRWSYEHFIGPIPDGMHIDHLCRNRRCVRPEHLEAVTQAENNQRAWDARKAAAR